MMKAIARYLALALVLFTSIACGTLSVQEEKQLGAQEQRRVRQNFQLLRDQVVVNYIRKLGADLVTSSRPSPFEFRFYVIEDESLNAFAVPGGAIYVHTGLILAANDVSELAGVMAHEIGHITARHSALQYKRARNTSIAAQLLGFVAAVLTGQPQATGLVTELGARAYLNTFTQDAEREADKLGVETMFNAGYDASGLVRFFETLQSENGGGPRLPQFLSTHPATPERISNARKEIEAAEASGKEDGGKADDGGRLEIIQERIRLIEGTDVEFDTFDEDEEGAEKKEDAKTN
jgi:beta-barrel assembly-enhancing protease